MTASALERVVRRDRAIVAAALVLIAILAWAYVVRLATHRHMAGDEAATDASMAGMMRPGLAAWSGGDALFMFAMWAVMMVAMMTPSVAPMVLVHARVARQARREGQALRATGWFVTGYFLAWVGFAAVATAAQWALERAALLTPAMATSSHCPRGRSADRRRALRMDACQGRVPHTVPVAALVSPAARRFSQLTSADRSRLGRGTGFTASAAAGR